MTSQKSADCTLIDRFSLKERIVMRSLWTAFTAVGVYGIWIRSPLWAVLYLVLTVLGFALVVLPALCAPLQRSLDLRDGPLLRFALYRLTPGQVPLVPVGATQPVEPFADPLPQALVLTAIVIGFGMTAFVVVLALRARADLGNDHVDGSKQ